MRVLLADDHSIIRNALKFMLQDLEDEIEFEEVRGYAALETRLGAEGGLPLDMVVMDLQMPGYEGLSQIRRIVEMAAPTPVAVFSMMEAVADMRAVLRQGVRAFIPKSTDEALIGTLLKLVAGGGTYVPAEVSGLSNEDPHAQPSRLVTAGSALTGEGSGGFGGGGLGGGLAGQGAPGIGAGAAMSSAGGEGGMAMEDPRLTSLTRRQREVLALMSQGLSNMEIGNRLGLNLSTVKTHVTGILKALDVDNRTQAVLLARGLSPR